MTIKLPDGISFFQRGWLSSNSVLLSDSNQSILIDSGYWTHAEQCLALVRSVIEDRRLTKLINTHLHSDHCGGNALLKEAFPSLEILIPPGHSEYVKQWNPEKLSYTPTGQHCPQFAIDGLLSDKDSFEISNKSWFAYAAPGHDPHSIILFCPQDGILISADALWQNGFGVVFPEIEGESAFDEVESTIDLIERLSPKVVIPGHGDAFTDIDGAIQRARTRLNMFRNSPEKHSIYASKVLIKFKLLELQTVSKVEFIKWAENCAYLKVLSQKSNMTNKFDAWIEDVLNQLQSSGSLYVQEDKLVNA